MNFTANDSSQGFYGEEDWNNQNHDNQNQMSNNTNGIGKIPFSSNSSSSSASQPHKNLVPLTFHHRHQQQQQNHHQRGSGSWFENINFESRRPISAAAAADEISSSGIRCYSRTGGGERGGAASNLDLMDASPSVARNNISEEEDDDVMMRRADSSSGGGGGERGGSASASGHVEVEREHMFDKVVTPSDVGKLNRLVIPKQHAEKFFPLDSSTNDKGLLLNFEDRNGKPWRFRYSYWNSSQSYVMTKGWSRFVKEKKLDAGDIVSFQRGLGDLGKDRLFIDWRRRPQLVPGQVLPPISSLSHLSPQHYLSFHRSTQPSSVAAAAWSSAASTPLFFQPQAASRDYSSHFHQFQQHQQHQYPTNASGYNQPHHSTGSYHGYGYGTSGGPYGYNSNSTHHPYSSSVVYLRSAAAAHVSPQQVQAAGLVQLQSGGGDIGGVEPVVPMVFESVPLVQGKAAAKRLRLFGVNMDCPISESDHECDVILSSTAVDATVPYAAAAATRPPYLSSSSSPLQLRLYNGSPVLSPVHPPDKGNSSSYKSFDLDS